MLLYLAELNEINKILRNFIAFIRGLYFISLAI